MLTNDLLISKRPKSFLAPGLSPKWRKGMGNNGPAATYTQPHVVIVLRAIEQGLIPPPPSSFLSLAVHVSVLVVTMIWQLPGPLWHVQPVGQYRGLTRRASTIQSCGSQPLRDSGTLSLGGLPSGKPMVAGHLFCSVLCPL